MRRLAAIMFTDIEGFTKLMRQNEAEALHVLERHRHIYTSCIKQFKGHTIKFIGDGTLTIFSSALQAVQCAIALQQAMQKDPSIPVRIGIHQGDVILEDKDILGDAVNLASRIQTSGIEGSILISEKVYDELQNHDEITTVALGSFNLKNIPHPINLYAIKATGIKVPDAQPTSPEKDAEKPGKKSARRRKALQLVLLLLIVALSSVWFIAKTRANEKNKLLKTIAVIPFENMDKDEENDFRADGLTQEMISLLSSNLDLTIKKISGNAISNNKENVEKLLSDIGVGCVLEGKVHHFGDSLYIYVSLSNVSTSEVVWSDTYHEKDLMSVQQKVATKIADAVNAKFDKTSIKNFVLDRTSNSDAYELYIKGRSALRERTAQSMREAIALFNQALQEDSSFALAYSGLGDTYTILVDNGYISYDSGVDLARAAVEHAFRLDSSSAEIRASRAIFFTTLEGRHKDALKELKLSLSLRPNYADAHQWYALELAADGQFDSALSHINEAIRFEPYSERIWANKGLILEFSRRYKEAISVLNNAIVNLPDNSNLFYSYKTDCHYWLKQKDSVLQYARFGSGALNSYDFWEAVCNNDKVKLQKLLQDEIASNGPHNETLAIYNIFMEQPGKALGYIKNAYNKKEFGWLVYLNVSPVWDPLHKEAAFQDIVSKLGLK